MGQAIKKPTNNTMVDRLVSQEKHICSQRVEGAFRAVDRAMYYEMIEGETIDPYDHQPWRRGNLHISAPSIYAQVVEALDLRPGLSFLNLGSGTGYLNTIVGLLVGPNGINHGIEYHSDVVEFARGKLAKFKEESYAIDKYDFSEPTFIIGNCLNLKQDTMKYDRVYLGAACLPEMELFMKKLIKVNGGILVMPYEDQLMRFTRNGENDWRSEKLLDVHFTQMIRVQADDQAVIEMPKQQVSLLKNICRVVIRQKIRDITEAENPHLIHSDNYKSRKRRKTRKDERRAKRHLINLDSDEDDDDNDSPNTTSIKYPSSFFVEYQGDASSSSSALSQSSRRNRTDSSSHWSSSSFDSYSGSPDLSHLEPINNLISRRMVFSWPRGISMRLPSDSSSSSDLDELTPSGDDELSTSFQADENDDSHLESENFSNESFTQDIDDQSTDTDDYEDAQNPGDSTDSELSRESDLSIRATCSQGDVYSGGIRSFVRIRLSQRNDRESEPNVQDEPEPIASRLRSRTCQNQQQIDPEHSSNLGSGHTAAETSSARVQGAESAVEDARHRRLANPRECRHKLNCPAHQCRVSPHRRHRHRPCCSVLSARRDASHISPSVPNRSQRDPDSAMSRASPDSANQTARSRPETHSNPAQRLLISTNVDTTLSRALRHYYLRGPLARVTESAFRILDRRTQGASSSSGTVNRGNNSAGPLRGSAVPTAQPNQELDRQYSNDGSRGETVRRQSNPHHHHHHFYHHYHHYHHHHHHHHHRHKAAGAAAGGASNSSQSQSQLERKRKRNSSSESSVEGTGTNDSRRDDSSRRQVGSSSLSSSMSDVSQLVSQFKPSSTMTSANKQPGLATGLRRPKEIESRRRAERKRRQRRRSTNAAIGECGPSSQPAPSGNSSTTDAMNRGGPSAGSVQDPVASASVAPRPCRRLGFAEPRGELERLYPWARRLRRPARQATGSSNVDLNPVTGQPAADRASVTRSGPRRRAAEEFDTGDRSSRIRRRSRSTGRNEQESSNKKTTTTTNRKGPKRRRENECQRYHNHMTERIRELPLPRVLHTYLNYDRDL